MQGRFGGGGEGKGFGGGWDEKVCIKEVSYGSVHTWPLLCPSHSW